MDKSEFGTAANHYLTANYRIARQQGLDVDAVLAMSGLDVSLIDKPESRIPTQKLACFQRVIWDLLADESSGLNAQELPRGSYHMMGYVGVHQPTLHKALAMASRFYNLITHKNFVTLTTDANEAKITFNLSQPELDYKNLFAELTLLAWHRYASWLIAQNIPLIETHFNYPSPAHYLEYHYLYPGIHKFDCKSLALIFPVQYLSRDVKQNEKALNSFIENCPLELFRRYKADYSISSAVKDEINRDVSKYNISIESVANKLHMTVRTLMRRLDEEGTSFQKLKDIIRHDKAIFYLQQEAYSIGMIADKIGFSDPAVFSRAFKKWTGVSPKEYRNKIKLVV